MKRLLILSLALVLVGYATSSCSSSASKDKERNDSIVVAELEAARLDSIRQDSIARRNFITPDLAFNDLHGDVKKCVCDNNEYLTYTYDENGKWTNEPQWNESDKKFCPDRTKHPRVIRNKDGYITRIYWECDADYEYEDISWKDGRVKTRFNSTYSYDNDFIITQENEEEYDAQVTYTYCNYEVDDMGNWVKRDVIEKITDTYQNSVRYEKKTETRNITYHKSNGEGRTTIPNNAKQEQALQALKSYSQKKEQEEAKNTIPDWMQGTWHLDINGPNGISVANYTIIINGNNATMLDGRQTKYSGECHIDNGKLYLGNSSSYDISGQSLYYRQYRLTKEGGSSSWSGSFRTDSDVMRYLTDCTFYSDSHRMTFTYNSCKIDGYAVSGAPRISNFSSTSATIIVNPIGGGRAVYLYLNASNGTINYDGDIFRVR